MKQLLPLIQQERYLEVKRVVKEKNISIDSHDWWENTPLTDAAKRGDVKGIKFLINEMGANVHASCDCPYHKTALHYASENGHTEAVKTLLKCGAKVNELDSRRYTALDVAKNQDIVLLLKANSGTKGEKVPVNSGQRLNLPKADCVHQRQLK